MLPVDSQEHNHVWRVLNNVARLGGGPATNGQANNGHETESVATATPSTSVTPLITSSCGQRATASTSTSAVRDRGRHATNPQVVTSLEIPTPIPHTSFQLEVPSPAPPS